MCHSCAPVVYINGGLLTCFVWQPPSNSLFVAVTDYRTLLFCFDSTRHSFYVTLRRRAVGGKGIYTDHVIVSKETTLGIAGVNAIARSIVCILISWSLECSAQGRVLDCKCRNLGCSFAEGRSSPETQEPWLSFTRDWIGAVDSRSFPHPTLSDLANWTLRTSPKFTTGVKYQFHQDFWPDQRFRNPNHPSPSFWSKTF